MASNISDPSQWNELTEEEHGWTKALRDAQFYADAEFAKTISDFQYAQHAIIAKDQVEKGLKRIRRLQEFKKAHGIADNGSITIEKAKEIIKKMDEKAPGFIMSFGREEKDGEVHGRHVFSMRYDTFLPANFDESDINNFFVGFYLWLEACQPDLESVRKGMAIVCECEGLGWKNFSLDLEKRAAKLYQDAYPIRIKEMSVLHPNRLMKVFYALCKPFLSKRVKEVFNMNVNSEDIKGRYSPELLPATLGGTQDQLDMFDKMIESLQHRLENEASFKL